MDHTLHSNWLLGFGAWALIVIRAAGLVVFYLVSLLAVLAILGAVIFLTFLMMLWAGIHVMLWFWPLQ